MRIELDEAIKIYARACQAWYRGNARNVALKKASELRDRSDHQGFVVWQQLAAELKAQAENGKSVR